MTVPVNRSSHLESYAGIGYAVCFVGSVMVSSPPADKASDHAWVVAYTGRSAQLGHLATGFLLLLAGLSLMTFLVGLWRRIGQADPARSLSPVPVAAAAVAAACMGTGGMLMGFVSGGELMGSYPLPGADVLRMSNDLGFALAGVAGSWAAGLAVAVLSIQGHASGFFGSRMRAAGLVTAGLLVVSILFAPILALIAWTLAASVLWMRRPLPTSDRAGHLEADALAG